MSVTFVAPTKFTSGTAGSDHIVKCGELHSLADLPSPKFQSRAEFFGSTQTSIHILDGSRGDRPIIVNLIISDSTFTTRELFDAYLETLDAYIGATFTLKIEYGDLTPPPRDNQEFTDCYLKNIQRVPQNEKRAITLPNYISAPVGPEGDFWHEANLLIVQAKI